MASASLAGLRILMTDHEPAALEVCRQNSNLTGMSPGSQGSTPVESSPASIRPLDITLCQSNQDAIEAVRQAQELEQPFSIVFLNVQNASEHEGIQAAEQIRFLDSQVTIVLVTDPATEIPQEALLRIPPEDKLLLISKPLRAQQIHHLARALEARRNAEQSVQKLREEMDAHTREKTIELTRLNIQLQKDLLQRQQVEADLRKSEEQYRQLLETTNVIPWEMDLSNCRFTYIGPQAIRLLGYSLEQLYQEYFLPNHIHPDDRDKTIQFCEAAIEGGWDHIVEFRVHKADGQIIWMRNIVSVVNDHPGSRVLRGFLVDITDQKIVEEALRQSEENYHAIFDASSEAIFVHDMESGRILDVNQKMCEMYGCTAEEARLLSLDCLAPGMESPYSAQDALKKIHQVAEEGPQLFEWKTKTRDGRVFWIEVNLKQVVIRGKERILAFVRNIDDRKRAEEEKASLERQLHQSQKMEAIGRLAGGIAHDFNNLLTAITGYSDLLLRRLDPDDPNRKDIEEILKAGESASSLTRQLQAFSRKQVLEMQILNLNNLIIHLDKMLRRMIGEDIDLVAIMAPELHPILADPGQIEQVIINLAVNARDAMPEGGKITIETANVVLDENYAQDHIGVKPGPHVMLAISDTGCGMDADTLNHIFEPFFTTKESGKGTGLGLSTVYGIVAQCEGSIWVYSEPGGGATFKIYFPVAQKVEQADDTAKPSFSQYGGTETILLVEDSEFVRDLASRVLRHGGYHVLAASCGEEALHICNEYPGEIHLMVTDVVMPEISGRQLAEFLFPLRPTMKVLFISGYTDDAILRHGILTQDTPFLQKPFAVEALLQKVQEMLSPKA